MLRVFENFGNGHLLALAFASILVFSALMLPLDIHAVEVIDTIPVGDGPMATSVNPNTNKIYVANIVSNDVSVIDGTTNSRISTIPVGVQPHDVKVNPVANMIYVSNWSGGISVIDGETDTVVSNIPISSPPGVGINPKTNLIYASSSVDPPQILVINGTTNEVVDKIPFQSHEQPFDPVVNPDTNRIYVPTLCRFCPESYVTVIEGNTNTRIMNIPFGKASGSAAINLNTNMIYGTDSVMNWVYVIDGLTNIVVAKISGVDGADIALNPTTNLIYVSIPRNNSTLIIDGVKNQIIDAIAVGGNPVGLTVNPTTNRMYVTNAYDDNVSVVDINFSVPSSPKDLFASAVSSSKINLLWSVPQNDGGSPITGYQIDKSTDNGATWTVLVSNTNSTSTEYSDIGLASNMTFAYRVAAINEVGTGPTSNTASATTFDATTPLSVNVNTVDKLGNPLEGIWMQLTSANGTIIAEGFTPITFDVVQGEQYTVYANYYMQHAFLYWEDGDMDSSRDVIPITDINMTATYTITTADQIASSE